MLATEIKNIRAGRKLTQAQLADAAGVSEGLIGLVETGRRSLGTGSIQALVAGLALSGADSDRLLTAKARDDEKRRRKPPMATRMETLEDRVRRIEDRLGIATDDAEPDEIARRREAKRPARPASAKAAAKRGTSRKRGPSGTRKVPRGSAPERGAES